MLITLGEGVTGTEYPPTLSFLYTVYIFLQKMYIKIL